VEIDEAVIREVALLARLELTDGDIATIAPQLARVLAHVDRIQQIDLGSAASTNAAVPTVGLDDLRDDAAGETLDPQAVLRNAPAHDGAFLVVPRFFDDEHGD